MNACPRWLLDFSKCQISKISKAKHIVLMQARQSRQTIFLPLLILPASEKWKILFEKSCINHILKSQFGHSKCITVLLMLVAKCPLWSIWHERLVMQGVSLSGNCIRWSHLSFNKVYLNR